MGPAAFVMVVQEGPLVLTPCVCRPSCSSSASCASPHLAAGTTFIVDGFAFASPRCTAYFLTHCHSDHTVGLRRNFAASIYCSPVSARLLAHDWGLRAPQVQELRLGQPRVLQGVTVTAIDANHCPGAVMLLFEVLGPGGAVSRILHTGDCRWVLAAAVSAGGGSECRQLLQNGWLAR
jgi:DNA cross-link repair 1A protein